LNNGRPEFTATLCQVFKWLILGGVILAILIGSAAIRKEILTLSFRLQALKAENIDLLSANDLLRAEYNSITAPQELEKASRKIGLVNSNNELIHTYHVYNLRPIKNQVVLSQSDKGALHE
jgi:hypothetical protein